MKELPATRPSNALHNQPDLSADNRATFERARRSLRLWPIAGDSDGARWQAVHLFLKNKLGLTHITETMLESVSRVQIPSGPRVVQEALVVFKDLSTRDLAIGSASKLAGDVDDNGRATSGMRIEVPSWLRQDFRVLFRYAISPNLSGQGTTLEQGDMSNLTMTTWGCIST